MSSMKDIHADLMDLLEQSVDDEGLDTSACSGEALHAARAFVQANGEDTVAVADPGAHDATERRLARVLATAQGQRLRLSLLTVIEIRRFAVSLDGSHRAHATRLAAARELGLLIDGPRGPIVGGPIEIPTDLRAELLRAFPLPAVA